jgi:hypothetical protein
VRVLVLCAVLAACKSDVELNAHFGGRCTEPSECEVVCLMPPLYPGGFCTLSCTADNDCPLGAQCMPPDAGAACLFSCFDDKDCTLLDSDIASGWKCRERAGRFVCSGEP